MVRKIILGIENVLSILCPENLHPKQCECGDPTDVEFAPTNVTLSIKEWSKRRRCSLLPSACKQAGSLARGLKRLGPNDSS